MDAPVFAPVVDYTDARHNMVDGQLRPNKVYDPRILNAMRTLPRERFLPPTLAARAYSDEDVPLGGGRALIEPMVIARLIEGLRPQPREKALVIGAGTGYGAAVLAACGVMVTALEQDEALLAIARPALAEYAPSVTLVSGALEEGWAPGGVPWDIILIEGAIPSVPAAIAGQLHPETGRLAAVLLERARGGHAVLGELVNGQLSTTAVFDCAIPALPAFMPTAPFKF
jgi:protein-L-isoaspartate(D-aspartate) O-methyltransferase